MLVLKNQYTLMNPNFLLVQEIPRLSHLKVSEPLQSPFPRKKLSLIFIIFINPYPYPKGSDSFKQIFFRKPFCYFKNFNPSFLSQNLFEIPLIYVLNLKDLIPFMGRNSIFL